MLTTNHKAAMCQLTPARGWSFWPHPVSDTVTANRPVPSRSPQISTCLCAGRMPPNSKSCTSVWQVSTGNVLLQKCYIYKMFSKRLVCLHVKKSQVKSTAYNLQIVREISSNLSNVCTFIYSSKLIFFVIQADL